MKKFVQMVLMLTLLGMLSGALLAGMYTYTSPLIQQHKQQSIERAIYSVLRNTANYRLLRIPHERVYQCFDTRGNFVGYAFLASGGGYQDILEIMVGASPDLENIFGIEILKSNETPGLGARITKEDFKKQFRNLKTEPEIEYVKNRPPQKPNEIQAISGATVSSSSVVRIVNQKLADLRKVLVNN